MRNKRAMIADLIRTLAAQQNPGKEFRFPEILFQAEDDDEVEEDEDSNQVLQLQTEKEKTLRNPNIYPGMTEKTSHTS